MASITSKELGAIGDALALEQNLVQKYTAYAACATDPALKAKYEDIAATHKRHYDELYSNLK